MQQQAAGGPGGMLGAPPGLHPSLAGMPGMPGFPPTSSAAGLLSLAGHPGLPPTSIQQLIAQRGLPGMPGAPGDVKDEKPGLQAMEDRLKHSSSASPASSRDPREGPRDLNHRPRSPISARSPIRSSTPNDDKSAKRLKTEDLRKSGHESDSGDKSEGDLVVDVGGDDEGPRSMVNGGEHANGNGERARGEGRPPSNLSSSSRSTPSLKQKEGDKPGPPSSKPSTPSS